MSRPAVTVLMAVHNTEPYLQEAIDSVLAQTLSDLELVIVDDGSTDGSWLIVEAAMARDARVSGRRRSSSGGASFALNDGLQMSQGRYVTRQDADDASLPTRLAEQVSFLETHPEIGACGTQAILIDAEGRRMSETSFPTANPDIQSTLIESMCFVGPTVLARRSTFERVGLWFDAALSGTEDYDLCLRLAEVSGVANIGHPLYLYRQHQASVSHRKRHQQLARKAQAVENAVRRRHGPSPPAEAWIDVARDYLRAAVVAHISGETGESLSWIERACRFYPDLFTDGLLVERVVRRYMLSLPADARLDLTRSLFTGVLPRTRVLRRLRSRLMAEWQLSALTATADGHQVPADRLWPAIRSNPAGLLKPAVLALLMKGAVGRALGSGRRAQP